MNLVLWFAPPLPHPQSSKWQLHDDIRCTAAVPTAQNSRPSFQNHELPDAVHSQHTLSPLYGTLKKDLHDAMYNLETVEPVKSVSVN